MTPNLAACLAVIRACEGTSGPNGYRTLFGGDLFDNGYVDHPRIVVVKSGYKSTAAGAYQALAGTWDDFIKAEGPHDFSPSSQDLFARWCIQRRGALADVEAGRLRAAISKCNKEWASLPGSPYGQPVRTLAYCEQIFRTNGGNQIDGDLVREPRPDAPTAPQPSIPPSTKEPRMGVAIPLLSSIIPQVLQLFSGRAQAQLAKVTGDSEASAAFMQDLIGKVGQVAGVPVVDDRTAVQAVAAITASPDPAKVQELEAHALDYLEKLLPLIDKIAQLEQAGWTATEQSRGAARQFSSPEGWKLRWTQASFTQKALGWGAGICAVLILGMSLLLIWVPSDARAAILNLIGQLVVVEVGLVGGLVNTFRDQNGFSFGGTVESNAAALGTRIANNALEERRQQKGA